MPEEAMFVASYDFSKAAPREIESCQLVFPVSAGVTDTVDLSVYSAGKLQKLVKHLRDHGLEVSEKQKEWGSLQEPFRSGLQRVYKEVDLPTHSTNCEPHIETPVRLGSAFHRKRRRVLERFLKSEGIAFTVNCATQHSDAVCHLVTEDDDILPETRANAESASSEELETASEILDKAGG